MFKDNPLQKYFCFMNGFIVADKSGYNVYKLSELYQPTVFNCFNHNFFYSDVPGQFELFFNKITGDDINKKIS